MEKTSMNQQGAFLMISESALREIVSDEVRKAIGTGDRPSGAMQPQKELLTMREAAEFTGLSRSYLYSLTSKSMIPFFKPTGKVIYFRRAELEDWLSRGRRLSQDEAMQAAVAKVSRNPKAK